MQGLPGALIRAPFRPRRGGARALMLSAPVRAVRAPSRRSPCSRPIARWGASGQPLARPSGVVMRSTRHAASPVLFACLPAAGWLLVCLVGQQHCLAWRRGPCGRPHGNSGLECPVRAEDPRRCGTAGDVHRAEAASGRKLPLPIQAGGATSGSDVHTRRDLPSRQRDSCVKPPCDGPLSRWPRKGFPRPLRRTTRSLRCPGSAPIPPRSATQAAPPPTDATPDRR